MRARIGNGPWAPAGAALAVVAHLAALILYVVLPSMEVSTAVLLIFGTAWLVVAGVILWVLPTRPWLGVGLAVAGAVLAGVARMLGEQLLDWRG